MKSSAFRASIVKIEDSGFPTHLNFWRVFYEVNHVGFLRGGNTLFIALRNAAREFQEHITALAINELSR